MKDKMEITNIETVYEGICHLGEGPVWSVSERRLFWTDIYNRRLWVYDPVKRQSRLYWEGRHQVGGFAFTKSGGLVLCTDKGVYILRTLPAEGANPEPELLYSIPMTPGERFNDITVDPEGRIFAGTVRPREKGVLYRLEKGKSPEAVLRGIGCSNGMTFSLDLRFFYHTDSTERTITRYRYNLASGEIDSPEILISSTPEMGMPDGMTMDSEGYLWSAFWGGSAVRRIDPFGRIVSEIRVPALQPSSVMFGGPDLCDLYITSSCQGASDLQSGLDDKGRFLGGPLYRCRLGVSGRPEWLADF
jgi:D-xylonolactonase